MTGATRAIHCLPSKRTPVRQGGSSHYSVGQGVDRHGGSNAMSARQRRPAHGTRLSYHPAPMAEHHGSIAAAQRLLREVESLVKHPSVSVELGQRGVNASIAILAVQALTAYFEGNRARALDDFSTVTEEIRARLERR